MLNVHFNQLLVPLLGICLISIVSGLLSPIIVLKQRSYLIDTLSHLILPGVVVGMMLSSVFHLEIWICMVIGAVVTALLGVYLSEWFLKYLKIPPDSSAILCLSAFLALGILILAISKKEPIDPDDLLFGDIQTITITNLIILFSVLIGVLSFLGIYKNDWNAWLSDPNFAKVAGFNTNLINKLFPAFVTIAVLASFFAVGALMIPAFMTIPAIFIRPKSAFPGSTILFSFVLGLFGFLFATVFNISVGPTIVLIGAICVIIKTFFVKKCEQTIPPT